MGINTILRITVDDDSFIVETIKNFSLLTGHIVKAGASYIFTDYDEEVHRNFSEENSYVFRQLSELFDLQEGTLMHQSLYLQFI